MSTGILQQKITYGQTRRDIRWREKTSSDYVALSMFTSGPPPLEPLSVSSVVDAIINLTREEEQRRVSQCKVLPSRRRRQWKWISRKWLRHCREAHEINSRFGSKKPSFRKTRSRNSRDNLSGISYAKLANLPPIIYWISQRIGSTLARPCLLVTGPGEPIDVKVATIAQQS